MVYDSVKGNCPKYLRDIFIPAHPIQIWLQVNGHFSIGDVTCGIQFPKKSSVQQLQHHKIKKKPCSKYTIEQNKVLETA